MEKTTYAALALGSLMLVPVAQAEPLSLSPAEMDSVTAGVTIDIGVVSATGGTGAAQTASVSAVDATCRDNCSVGAVGASSAAASGTGGSGSVGAISVDLSSLFNGAAP